MRRAPRIDLTAAEREELEEWLHREPANERLALRARVILLAAASATNGAISRQLDLHPETVGRWRHRFQLQRLEGIRRDAPRPTSRRRVPRELVERIVRMTRDERPPSGGRWTTRSLARVLQVNHMLVHRVWRSQGLPAGSADPLGGLPSLPGTWVEVMGVYLGGPSAVIVFGVGRRGEGADEPPTHSRGDAEPSGSAGPSDRASLFSELIGAFSRVEEVLPRISNVRRAPHELLVFLRNLEESTSPAVSLHPVFDRPLEYVSPKIGAWLEEHPRFRVHSAPAAGSWLQTFEEWVRPFRTVTLHPESLRGVRALTESLARAGPEVGRGRFSWSLETVPRNLFVENRQSPQPMGKPVAAELSAPSPPRLGNVPMR